MEEFAVTITCKLNETDKSNTSIVLTSVSDTNINLTSSMTTHPVVSGDIIADHIYKNPGTMNFSGVFSLNGSKGIVIDNNGLRLDDVQTLFEKIKDEGILCTIVKINTTNLDENLNQKPSFKVRENMTLTGITWVERINSMGFNLSFTQALLSDVQEFDIDIDDNYLPNISEPATLNFTDTLIDWEQIDAILIKSIRDLDLMTDKFLNYLKSMSKESLVGMGIGLAVATVLIVALHIPVIGWAAAGIIAAVGIIGGFIAGIIKGFKKQKQKNKYKIEQFRYYQDDRKNQREVQRFSNFVGEVHKQLSQLNNHLKVYSIASDEDQEAMVTIDNNYYIFTFTKNKANNNPYYSLNITDINSVSKKILSNISSSPTDIGQLTSSNYLFRADEGGSYIYLICIDEKDKQNLKNYYILVSSINMDEYNKTINNIIKNALIY